MFQPGGGTSAYSRRQGWGVVEQVVLLTLELGPWLKDSFYAMFSAKSDP